MFVQRVRDVGIWLVAIFFLFQSYRCSSSLPKSSPRYASPNTIAVVIPTPEPLIPAGWNDVTAQSQLTGMLYCLASDSLNGVITLKELSLDGKTYTALEKENIDVVGKILLRLKIAEHIPERRITRTPYAYGNNEAFSSFVYSDNGLLRRIVVLRKGKKFFTSELLQENTKGNFDILSENQLLFLERFMNGKNNIDK